MFGIKRLIPLTGVLVMNFMITVGVPSAAQADTVELRLGTGTPPSHVWSKAAQRLAARVAEETNNEVEISVFPASQLGSETDLLQQIQVGVVDMGVISAAATSARAPAFLAWFSPFILKDVEATIAASKGKTAQKILDMLQPQGIRGMGYVFAGMRQILMAKQNVETLKDLNKRKIRITPFPGMQVWWSAAGAVPTPVQLADVYQSLESGLLDGVDIDLDALVGLSLQNVASDLIVTNHMAFPGVVMMNEGAWSKLSEAQQQTVSDVLEETLKWASDLQIEAEKSQMAQMEKEIRVTHLENAKEMFAPSNQAFNKAFKDIPEIQELQEELAP
jgi:TRAP-type C4-dicarboxylate transport system substrate-binding protein